MIKDSIKQDPVKTVIIKDGVTLKGVPPIVFHITQRISLYFKLNIDTITLNKDDTVDILYKDGITITYNLEKPHYFKEGKLHIHVID